MLSEQLLAVMFMAIKLNRKQNVGRLDSTKIEIEIIPNEDCPTTHLSCQTRCKCSY